MFNLIFIVMAFDPLNFATGLGTNMLFNSINQNQYRDNQRFAQQLAQENAMFQDNLTRKLTRDTPVLERQGLVNAGINPAMLKDGTMAAQQGAQVNQMPVNTAPYFSDSMPSYASLLQSSLVSSEIDKNKAQAKNLQSDTEYKNQQTQQLAEYNKYQGKILKANLDKVSADTKLSKEQASQYRALAEKTWSEWEMLVPRTQLAKDFAQTEYNTMVKNLSLLDEEINKMKADTNLSNEQAETEKSKRAVNYSQASLNAVMARYNGILADFAKHGISLNSFVGSIAALVSQPDAKDFLKTVTDNISTVISQAGEQMIPQVINTLISTIIKLPSTAIDSIIAGVKDGIKNTKDKDKISNK